MSAQIEKPKHLSRQQIYYYAHREQSIAHSKLHYRQHLERYKEYRDKNRELNRLRQKRRNWEKLGLDVEEAHLIWDSASKCEICDIALDSSNKNLDHNHVTKQIRGVLCSACNRGLGNFRDNPETLAKAIKYIQESLK